MRAAFYAALSLLIQIYFKIINDWITSCSRNNSLSLQIQIDNTYDR